MSRTDTLKSTGKTLVDTGRTGLLAAIGAGDVAFERARSAVDLLLTRTEQLPGEAQVQADLAAKEARTRAELVRERAQHAAALARARAELAGNQAAAAAEQARTAASTARTAVTSGVRPDAVVEQLTGLVGTAREQALATLEELAGRGEKLVGDLRTSPALRRVVGRTEQVVDTVETTVEDVADTAADAVAEASDTVTSVTQQSAARTGAAIDSAEELSRTASVTTKRAARKATAEKPAKKAETPKSTARKATAPKSTAATADTTPVPDPTAVPAKSTGR